MLWAGSLSAPNRDVVIAVDRQKAKGVWSFSEGTFRDDLKSFISDVAYLGNNEEGVRTLGTSCQLLTPHPVREFAIRQETGRTWVCCSQPEQALWKISFTFNDAGGLDDFAILH